MGEHTFDATVVLERVRELPGGLELIDLARGRTDVALVGGAVRDLMLGRDPRELDVVVGGGESSATPALLFAQELAARLDSLAETNAHERFGTALVAWDGARVDVASARRSATPRRERCRRSNRRRSTRTCCDETSPSTRLPLRLTRRAPKRCARRPAR